MPTVELPLSFDTPPLNANQRGHWAPKARQTAAIRHEVHIRAKGCPQLPLGLPHITAALHYRPKVKRRRDVGNLYPTFKPCLDGLVDAGVIPDDTPTYVTELMPVIHAADRVRGAACWLQIDWNDQ